MSFVAQFIGHCVECDETIQIGQRVEGTESNYTHTVCPDPTPTPLDITKGEKVCPDCFLIHNGGCW